TALSSFVGGSIGIILMMLFSPIIVSYALQFGSAEYFALMVLGLVAASSISAGSVAKSYAMVVAGIVFGIVGMDIYTGAQRFTFGIFELDEGLSIVALAMGIFGVAEVIATAGQQRSGVQHKVELQSMTPTRDDWRRFPAATLRGTAVGSIFGALPGTGSTISTFIAYALEKRVSRNPERFGEGAVEGVIAPEAANNAADQTAFIPTLTLGIPGSATMALMIGALMIQGITPGPSLMIDHPDVFWGLVMSFWLGNLLLLILNIPLIGIWVRLLTVPFRYLYPVILVFICIGVFSLNNNAFGIWIVVFFGALGTFMRWAELPAASLLLGFVLGPLMEEHFRRAMAISGGQLSMFIDRPISAVILGLTSLILLAGLGRKLHAALWGGTRTRS
ncbi:MAG: tripartite tricarboxylate transporter permease, partial [Hyphomicrobiaceae bacterium]